MEDVRAAIKGERRRHLTKQARGEHAVSVREDMWQSFSFSKGLPLGFFRDQVCQEFKFKNLLYLFLFKVR